MNPYIYEQFEVPLIEGSGLKTSRFILKDQMVGLELEAEGITSDHWMMFLGEEENGGMPTGWHCTGDGSLRNEGREFLLSTPVCGRTLFNRINNLCKFLDRFEKYQGTPITHNMRTSLHVHLNFSNKTKSDVFAFVVMYLIFEKILARYCGKSRSESPFSVPIYKTVPTFEQIESYFIYNAWKSDERHKYAALNLAALGKYGTLEVRLHGGTQDKDEIIKWINILFCLIQAGEKYLKKGKLQRLPQLISSQNMIPFAINVFGEYWTYLREVGGTQQLGEDILNGVRVCQDLIYFYKFD